MLDDGGYAMPTVADIPRHSIAMNNINAAHPTNPPALYRSALPDSQESFLSAASSTFSAPHLLSLSSNVSTSTAAETHLTSPSTNPPSSQSRLLEKAISPSPTRPRVQNSQHVPPRIDTCNAPRTGDTAASPMSLDSPVAQGFKRTADGLVKGVGSRVDGAIASPSAHKRTKSTESGSNTRIGELSAQLKTRLSYAMVKVQNGWEKQSLEELEDQTSQRGSPISAPGRTEGTRPSFESPRTTEGRRRPSGVSENSDPMILSPGHSTPSDVSRSLAATPPSYWRPGPKPYTSAPYHVGPTTTAENGPILAPAAEIGSRRKRRSSAAFAPPPLLGSTQRKHYSDLGSAPQTPTTAPRRGPLRMPSQQAEKDAVDTLLFMSSPNNSSRIPHTSMDAQSQPSPLRSEMPTRRVMFENQDLKGKNTDRQQYRQGNSTHPNMSGSAR